MESEKPASRHTAACPWCGEAMTAGGTCVACIEAADTDGPEDAAELGDYEILEKIGRGGMGVVFKARHRSNGRTFAVKMLAGGPLASETFVARFKAEAEAAAALDHPGLVAVHEVGEDECGTPWFSMDYIAGPSLEERLQDGPLEAREAARLTKLVAIAMDYAHGRGLLHRDLKPSNILLDEAGEPRVTDFGIARRLDDENSRLTATGDVLGSPAYMPPEQAAGRLREMTAASDVYALGAVLYEMLTGRPPFAAPTRAAVLDMVHHTDPPAPRKLLPAIPVELETVCLKCLEKEPRRRYATAAALAGELDRFLRGERVLARPVGTAGHLWRWARRNKGAAAAVATLFLGLTTVAAVLAVMNLRVSRARSTAEHHARESGRYAAESREHLAHNFLLTANRHLESGDHQAALLWLHQAYTTTANPAERRLIRMSLATTLRAAPRLIKVWAPGGNGECAVFDATGTRIACAGGFPEVQVWSADPANDATLTLTHEGGAYGCGFNADGSRIYTQGRGDVRLWDGVSGKPVGKVMTHMMDGGHFTGRQEPCFTADGQGLLTFTGDGARMTRTADGNPSGPELKGPAKITTATMLPDGKRCLLGCGKTTVLVDCASGGPLHSWSTTEDVRKLFPDAKGERFAALCGNGTFCIFSTAGDTVPPVKFTSPGVNYQALFSPDGKQVLTTSFTGQARTFDAATGAGIREFSHSAGVARAVWYQGSTPGVATSSWDNTVRLWRLSTGQQLAELHHGGRTTSVAVTNRPQRILTASADGSVRLYERTGDNAVSRMHARLRVSRSQPWSAGVAWINDRLLKMCRPGDGELFGGAMLHQHPVVQAALAATAGHVATLTSDGTVHLWDAGGLLGLPLATLPASVPAVKSLAFSADGTRLLMRREDGSFTLCDGKGNTVCAGVRPPGGLRAWGVSQNDLLLVALGTDGRAQAWRMSDGQPAGPAFGPGRGAWTLTISPAGDAVCLNEGPPNTLDVKRAVRLWNPVSGEPLTPPLEHYDDIGAVAFSPDGRLLATGSEDFQVTVWDRQSGRPAASSWQHSFWPKLLAFSPDSQVLAIAGNDSSFTFLRTADCTQIGPRRQWQSPPQFITFDATGESLLALRADNMQDTASAFTVFQLPLTGGPATDEALADAVTLTSGMTLEKNGIVRLLTPEELVTLWRKTRSEWE